MEDGERIAGVADGANAGQRRRSPNGGARVKKEQHGSTTPSPNGSRPRSRSSSMSQDEAKPESDSVSTPDTAPAPKLTRKPSQREVARSAPLFDHLPDVTDQSCEKFQVIADCLYGSKHMGSSEHDALDCDCQEEWRDGRNYACGEDSDCINRATKMECVDGDCNCGRGCENQRFQRKQYADVSVIKTEKKGFGLRANSDMQANDFIFEYIGEVINEPTFRRRMMQYDDEGIKHFYFMSLTKHEFVDATKKGNLGRFCNHSCNPNCYVDKWVVGDKLRMGIFAGRKVKAGEELVFNYNVDRYGADPQPCYCGEPNCTGFIGGKTQTERATKLPLATIEALGIEDADSWDTAVAKKPRKKKPTEDDEEYVNRVQPRGLAEEGVTKVMAALMQCKEKWIAVKLLARIQEADEERVLHRVVRMHGYQILKTTLNTFIDDVNVVLQILNILDKLPRMTKNKIADSKIETTIEELTASEHEEVAAESKRLLDSWSTLETAYRIPRKKFDPSAGPVTSSFDTRRGASREAEVAAKPPSPFHNVAIPKGPRSNIPQRNAKFFNPQRPRRTQGLGLPPGWFAATDDSGRPYYYDKDGATTWQRPTTPAGKSATPKGPSKAQQDQDAVQNIIDSLTKETPRVSGSQSQTPQGSGTPAQEARKEKWRSYPIEKQKKIYENTLFAPVKSITDRYRHKLPKDELKRFAKEVNKKLVESDYRHSRVDDPTRITGKQEKKVKSYVKDFFDKAVRKHQDREKHRAGRSSSSNANPGSSARDADAAAAAAAAGADAMHIDTPNPAKESDDMPMSDDDVPPSPSSSERKRKRTAGLDEDEDEDVSRTSLTPSETPSLKRLKEDEEGSTITPPPAPPPPPPPPEGARDAAIAEEQELLREQEEALVRENEEAQRMADLEEEEEEDGRLNGAKKTNGVGVGSSTAMDLDGDDDAAAGDERHLPKQEVLGH